MIGPLSLIQRWMEGTQSGVSGHFAVPRVEWGSKYEAGHAVHLHQKKRAKTVLDWETVWKQWSVMKEIVQQVTDGTDQLNPANRKIQIRSDKKNNETETIKILIQEKTK